MIEKEASAAATAADILSGSSLMQQGRADVFRQREQTRVKKVWRAATLFLLVDAFLAYRYVSGQPFKLPTLGDNAIYMVPAIIIGLAIMVMMVGPLLSGRSPHLVVYPEQVEVGLTDMKGLDSQVDEVVRSLDVFLGHATFRAELGGTPRRGILFEGPPGTGKTFLAKAMAKEAGVPFLFISAPSMTSHWQGMSAHRIRSFYKALRKAARKEGGAIGFIEEIDAIAMARSTANATPAPQDPARSVSNMTGNGDSGAMVNELLIQMQSFDQPAAGDRVKAKLIGWVNGYLPANRRMMAMKPTYSNILLIAATNRADSLDPALLRPGRFDRRLYFDVPTKAERRDLIDFFLDRKSHHQQLDSHEAREHLAFETFGYTPVMIEHLFDEGLLVALRNGRREMNNDDIMEAKFTEEIGTKQPVVYTDADRDSVATHESGHATVAYILGKGRRLEVLSIIKRRGSLGLLAHSEEEERFTQTKTEIEAGIAIALGGLVAEEMVFGESGTGPASDLAHATELAARMVGSFGMAGSLISFDAMSEGPLGGKNLVARVLGDGEGKERVEDILVAQKERVRAVLEENRDIHTALRTALVQRDELVRDEILEVVEKTLAGRN
ncbi:MAG: cell division protease FtsH [Actinomycetota bacterium]|nr:cell division protease FtsH [Actinomycetota bacterium]